MIESNTNAFQKFWRGQYGLAVTFWGFFAVGFFVLTNILGRLLWPVLVSVPYWWFMASTQMLYGVIVGVAVWRSANNYGRFKAWAVSAKVAICVWFGASLWVLASTMPHSN